MRSKMAGFIAGAVATAVITGGISFAAAGTSSGQTLRTYSVPAGEHFVNNGPEGFGPGDVVIFTERLYDRATEAQIGRDRGECTLMLGGRALCRAAVIVHGRGQIFVEGVAHFADETSETNLSITGGTGEFEGAGGHLRLTQGSNHHDFLTFFLQ